MPKNPNILSNEEALRQANARVVWKRALTAAYFKGVDYELSKVVPFDDRDMYTLAPLLIDISSVEGRPESEKIDYFREKLKELEQDFILSKDPGTRLKYLKKMYESVSTSYDIDWNSVDEIDHLLCSMSAQQMLGTMMEKLPREIMSIYPTKEEAKKLDTISIKNYTNMTKIQNATFRYDNTINKSIDLCMFDSESYNSQISDQVSLAFAEAADKNSNIIVIDPTQLDTVKKHFLNKPFSIDYKVPDNPNDPNTDYTDMSFDSDDASKGFMSAIFNISGRTLNECMVVTNALGSIDLERAKLLLIDGRSVHDLVQEKINNEGMENDKAIKEVGRLFRDALTDGKSIVTMLRPSVTADGKIDFDEQEIKVDLDKLNTAERNEKHNAFRRALDYLGISKIPPKYPSNKERDEKQAETLRSKELKNAIKAAKRDFVNAYNKRGKENREAEEKAILNNEKKVINYPFLHEFPEVSPVENLNDLNDDRELMSISHEALGENNSAVEPMINEETKVLDVNKVVQ